MKSFLKQISPVDDEVLVEYLAQFEEYALPGKSIITEAGKIITS